MVVGLGFAPIYPSIIHATPAHFGRDNSQAVIGIQMASAYVGSTFSPLLFGLLAGAAGLRAMPVWLLAFIALSVVMLEWTEKLTAGAKKGTAPENAPENGAENNPDAPSEGDPKEV